MPLVATWLLFEVEMILIPVLLLALAHQCRARCRTHVPCCQPLLPRCRERSPQLQTRCNQTESKHDRERQQERSSLESVLNAQCDVKLDSAAYAKLTPQKRCALGNQSCPWIPHMLRGDDLHQVLSRGNCQP